MSKIEWTEKTWNPLVGCDKVSAGCKNCYAIRMAWRLMHNPRMKDKYAGTVVKTAGGDLNWTGHINFPKHDASGSVISADLRKPLEWKNQMVFVNSMSDLFHKDVPDWFIDCVFAIMVLSKTNTFQVLSKRPDRMVEYFSVGRKKLINRWEAATYRMGLTTDDEDVDLAACSVANLCTEEFPRENIWLGVSVEDQKAADERIPLLLQVPAAVRFLSCEPLLGPVDISDAIGKAIVSGHSPAEVNPLHWAIVGGESGAGARPMHPDWARGIRDQCISSDIAFFFKQWGLYGPTPGIFHHHQPYKFEDGTVVYRCTKAQNGRMLDGEYWEQFPQPLNVIK